MKINRVQQVLARIFRSPAGPQPNGKKRQEDVLGEAGAERERYAIAAGAPADCQLGPWSWFKPAGCWRSSLPALLSLTVALAASAVASDTAAEFSSVVPFELGEAEFSPGDSITIQSVRGTSSTIRTAETYCVEGTYTLASRENADLALFATTVSKVATRTDPSQRMRIAKGSGTFRLVKTMREEGYLHVSFYPVPAGGAFGGIYFGQGKWALHQKGWSYRDQQGHSPDYTATGGSTDAPVSLTGPNRALLEYLGNPVEPPAKMDAAYTKAGLLEAVQTAAQSAGISVKRVEIDDSEFPFLVGVICREGDYEKLKEQFRKMDAYEYGGSVGSHTCHAFNLVPYRAFPSQLGQHISHRTTLRMQVFQEKLRTLE